MQTPLISVLMTAYNREQFIGEAIESVLASTYKNFELIIVDDNSKDTTVNTARAFEGKDSRIRVYENEHNLGDYPNRNKAASYAKGEWLLFVDSDDTIYADGMEKCVKLMQQYPEASFGMRLFNEDTSPYKLCSNATIQKHFFEKPILTIGPGGTIIRRIFFEEINRYPVKYGPANDRYFNLKAACNTSLVLIPFEFLFYRRHEGQEINNHFSYLYNNYLYLKDALQELPLPISPEQLQWIDFKNKRRFLVNIINYFLRTFNFTKTVKAIKRTHFGMKDFYQAIVH